MQTKIKVQLFLGCLLTPDVKLKLLQTNAWQKNAILSFDDRIIHLIHHEEKDYIGVFLVQDSIPLESLENEREMLIVLLGHFLPNHDFTNEKIFLFAQKYIA